MPSDTNPCGILIACGGTGGHLFPGIAVGEELIARGHEVIFIISEKEIDRLASDAYRHLRFERIPSMAMPKPWSPRMVPFLSSFGRAMGLCRGWIREISAGAVLGMGGFTSAAPLVAARLAGKPGLIHESNAVPGRANRLNARFAREVLVGWEACATYFPAEKVKVVGTPVRGSFGQSTGRAEARASFELDPELFTVLVMGGSQGAKGINDLVAEMLPALDGKEIQLLHIAGPSGEDSVMKAYLGSGLRNSVMAFCSDMERAYAAADVSICRSGASSLNEMAVVGLPGILIPYPHAADDHQTRNAEVFVKEGACLMVQERDLNGTELSRRVVGLKEDAAALGAMKRAMLAMAPTRSAGAIADLIGEVTT